MKNAMLPRNARKYVLKLEGCETRLRDWRGSDRDQTIVVRDLVNKTDEALVRADASSGRATIICNLLSYWALFLISVILTMINAYSNE